MRVCGFDSHLGYYLKVRELEEERIEIRSTNDPVVQRRRLLAHIQATMVRVHPGSLNGLLVQEEGAGSARRK